MASYKYTIKDYHAIKEADIILDGITVLSGVNGCGKSTLSRWLYYIINGSVNYDINLFEEYKEKLYSVLTSIHVILRDVERTSLFTINSDFKRDKILILAERLSEINYFSEKEIDKVTDLYTNAIDYVGANLNELMYALTSPRKERILSYLEIDSSDYNEDYSELFLKKYKRLLDNLHGNLIKKIMDRPIEFFFKHIHHIFKNEDDDPDKIRFEEDGVDIIDNTHILNILNLHNVIYIDSPLSVTAGDYKNPFWHRLQLMMLYEKSEITVETKKILRRVKSLMGGETYIDEDNILGDKTLRYKSYDNKINIDLSNAATGFKTLAYLQRLLENGYIDENTLLIIDEPEAHLHPQWIVEFARLLVLLNKKLGLKIMLASHNPDMVAAIQAIAVREGISEHTNFYVAKPDAETPHQYVYKHLGMDISEIFESFNLAIDRIKCYGDVCD